MGRTSYCEIVPVKIDDEQINVCFSAQLRPTTEGRAAFAWLRACISRGGHYSPAGVGGSRVEVKSLAWRRVRVMVALERELSHNKPALRRVPARGLSVQRAHPARASHDITRRFARVDRTRTRNFLAIVENCPSQKDTNSR